jgi:phosphoglycolate phosphatase-like HAD superfamily hydrolase
MSTPHAPPQQLPVRAELCQYPAMSRLILFDIDGTLTRTKNGYIPFNEALLQTFGHAGDIRRVIPDGNTDPLIVQDIFAKASVALTIGEHEWSQFSINLRERYHYHVRRGTTAVRALPGAAELLKRIASTPGLSASVVTGNFEVTAEVKLEAAGLRPHLMRGAYASDSPHRADLPAIARRRWEEKTGRSVASPDCIVIRDTPHDLAAARHNKMKCILVGTGRYPVEELLYCEPDRCLPDLSDTDAVLAELTAI